MRILTCDLNDEAAPEDYDEFYDVIDNYDYYKLSESSYALNTKETPDSIFAKIVEYLDKDDNVMIFNLERPLEGQHRKEIIDWLRNNM